MNALSTERFTHIWIRKDKTELYITEKWSRDWESARKAGYWNLLILRDLEWFVTFKGTADLIEEIKEIEWDKINAVKAEQKAHEDQVAKATKNKTKKQKWTQDKLQSMKDDEIEYFVDKAKDELKNYIEKELVWEQYIQEYAMCLMRKYFNCPYV